MLRTDELDYHLPEDLIAVRPAEPRDSARLMVVRRADPARVEHRTVRDLPELLDAGDLLVFNRSRVLPARFFAVREDTGGKAEGLYLRDGDEPGTWEVMVKARRKSEGAVIRLLGRDAEPGPIRLTLLRRVGDREPGAWLAKVEGRTGEPADACQALAELGFTPLPPYIVAARKRMGLDIADEQDRAAYQTVYAAEAGSVAAPTAGLHFTPDLLGRLDERGVERGEVVLHVGTGTFKPVETETVEAHQMHSERCALTPGLRQRIEARMAGRTPGRVIPVGTTSARTLESFARLDRDPDWLETEILITPGHDWRWAHGLLTNFHLPRSTLMAMVASLLPGGASDLRSLYKLAVAERYRFYSYGDAMLLLP